MGTPARITVSAMVNKPVAHVWDMWTDPAHKAHAEKQA